MIRRKLGIIAVGLLLTVLVGAAPPATQEGARGAADDVFKLGDADAGVRDAAMDRLWRAGSAAEPLLGVATKSDNPERAERARALLRDIEEGLTPATSPEVAQLVRQYQSGSAADKFNAINQLGQSGVEGTRILLNLDRTESDPNLHDAIRGAMRNTRMAVALLLREHEEWRAKSLLRDRVAGVNEGAEDFAAYLLLRGELPAELAAMKKNSGGNYFSGLCTMEKASGDAPAAARFAEKVGNLSSAETYLKDAGDWAGVAKLLEAHPTSEDEEPLGARCLMSHFIGPSAAGDKLLDELMHVDADRQPDDFVVGRQAVDLCMLDHPADAIDKLIGRSDFGAAVELLDSQMDYGRALSLLPRMASDTSQGASDHAALAAMFQLVGKPKEAKDTLLAARKISLTTGDLGAKSVVCRTARQIHQDDVADRLILRAVSGGEPDWQQVQPLMSDDYRLAATANSWRRFLAERSEPLIAIRQALAIADGHCPREKLLSLSRDMEAWALAHATADERNLLEALATTLESAGEFAAAADVRQRCAELFPTAEAWTALGDAQSQLKNWPAAIEAYGKAADVDPTAALPAFGLGWAMTQSGDAKAGREQMDLAHVLALGDLDARWALRDAARERHLDADADREQAAIIALADVDNIHMVELNQTMADEEGKAGHYAEAAKHLRQVLAAVVEPGVMFLNTGGYAIVASKAHCFDALGDFAAHRLAAAMAEAKIAFADWPANDGMIDLVRAADAAGDHADADALYAQARSAYANGSATYPDSAVLHNQLAWFESRCHRNLDDALVHAQRAVDLSRVDCAILDTLAETHYQRGEFQAAIDTISRCIELQPKEPHHRKQLVRFRLGLVTGVVEKD